MEGQSFLILVQEPCLSSTLRKIPIGEDCEGDSKSALDYEEPPPLKVDEVRLDLEYAVGEEATESAGNVGGSVEDGQAASELSSAVECRLVIDYEGKEGTLRDTKQEPQGKDATKILGSRHQERA